MMVWGKKENPVSGKHLSSIQKDFQINENRGCRVEF